MQLNPVAQAPSPVIFIFFKIKVFRVKMSKPFLVLTMKDSSI